MTPSSVCLWGEITRETVCSAEVRRGGKLCLFSLEKPYLMTSCLQHDTMYHALTFANHPAHPGLFMETYCTYKQLIYRIHCVHYICFIYRIMFHVFKKKVLNVKKSTNKQNNHQSFMHAYQFPLFMKTKPESFCTCIGFNLQAVIWPSPVETTNNVCARTFVWMQTKA